MQQKQRLEEEYRRLKIVHDEIQKLPPSDERATLKLRTDKIKNYIIFADKLINENKDVGIIIDRIHQLINDLLT